MIVDGLKVKPLTQYSWLVKYALAQMAEEIRFLVLKPFVYVLPRRHRAVLQELRRRGYTILRNYYSEETVAELNSEIDKRIRPLLTRDYPGLSVIPGSKRFRRPEKISALFRFISREPYWVLINAFMTGRPRFPGLMLSFTEAATDNSEIEIFADHPHFDAYQHEIKVVVALTDVTESSGPTEMAVSSGGFHWKYWREYFSSWLDHYGILESKTKTISQQYYECSGTVEYMLLKKGDVAIFDSRNLHRATNIVQGRRDLLWFYF